MSIASGTKLGPYEITGAIGAGGMGEVYRAHDPKLGRDVAIKVLPEAFARDAERMARFQREAKVLASLDHPNIATIHGLEESGGTRALVMQLVEGPTLADRIKSGPISVDEAVRIAKQIADALEYAHERGIIHRDLKPANVKVTNDDAVKVLDFGLAKALEGDPSSIDISTSPTISRMATQAGVLLGTAAYMSPEQAKAKSVDRRADIWAFGCVLYEMLTGKVAFPGDSVTDTLAGVIRAEPDWSQLPAATPMRLRVLLQRCLQKDPKQRLRDIGDARISLDEVLSGASEGAPSPGATSAAMQRRLWWAWGVAALLFVTAALLAFVHFRESPAAPTEPARFQIALSANLGPSPAFAVSPDGRSVAFAGTASDGVTRLWIRPLDSLEARPIPGTEGISTDPFFWSPDSRYIVFRSLQGGSAAGGSLKKIEASGGPAESLGYMASSLDGGSWNREGAIVVGQSPGGLMRIAATGGGATPLTIATGTTESSGYPQFLPDGRHIIYSRFGGNPNDSGVFVASLDAKPEAQTPKRLLKDISRAVFVPSYTGGPGYLLFGRDGVLMALPFDAGRLESVGEAVALAQGMASYVLTYDLFSASDNGVVAYTSTRGTAVLNQLTWYDRQGKVQGTVSQPTSEDGVNLSPDGKRAFVFDSGPANTGLWLLDFSRGTRTRFTFGPSGITGDALWSPDGNSIIFMSSREGPFASIYEKPVSGATDQLLLLTSTDQKHPRSWSRDGLYLFYDEFESNTGKSRIRVLPLKGDKKPLPVQPLDFNEGSSQISSDGRWLAYASDETGRAEVYVRAFSPDSTRSGSPAGGKWLISSGGGTDPRWRADGKEIFYLTSDGKVMAVDITTSPSFQAGVPRLLFQGPPLLFPFGVSKPSQWGVAADGKRFLFQVPLASNPQSQLTILLNWQAALKK